MGDNLTGAILSAPIRDYKLLCCLFLTILFNKLINRMDACVWFIVNDKVFEMKY